MTTRDIKFRQMQAKQRSKLNDKRQGLRSKLAATQPQKTLCLTMIVKNESKIITRLLDSLKTIVDFISIVDTGSTDDTILVISNWGKTNSIPTTVHQELFRDFSHNRTHSVLMAQKTYPQADFLLLSDADFIWEINQNGLEFKKQLLIDQKYLVEQQHGVLRYWNVRLLDAKVDWECVGLTHEYWGEKSKQTTWDREVRVGKIRALRIDDREDGGCKTDKHERDERLLTRGLNEPETHPGLHTRYKFYLAQTLKILEKYQDSIDMYNQRIKAGGYPEEVYVSYLNIGNCWQYWGWKVDWILQLLVKATEAETANRDVPGLVDAVTGEIVTGEIVTGDSRLALPEGLDESELTPEDREFLLNHPILVSSQPEVSQHQPEPYIESCLKSSNPFNSPYLSEADQEYIAKWNPKHLDAAGLMAERDRLFANAFKAYEASYKFRRTRLEGLAALSKLYRELSMNAEAFEVANRVKQPKFPAEDTLFVEADCYDWRFDFEVCITAFYLEDKKRVGQEAISRLLDNPNLPEPIRNQVLENSRFYT